jgi:hypothetical protein
MDKEIMVYMYIDHGILLSHKEKNGIISLAGKWMELEIIILNEIRQVRKPNVTCSCSFVELKIMVIDDSNNNNNNGK